MSKSELAHNPPSFDTLQGYEQWASTDWLHKIGSDEAQQHVRLKLEEEVTELSNALGEKKPEAVLDELGDVLWTATANAHNAGITLEDSFRHAFTDGAFGNEPILTEKIDDMSSEFVKGQSVEEISSRLNYLTGYLGKAANQWHNLGPLIEVDSPPETFSEAWIKLKAKRAEDSLVEIVITCSALAQEYCGESLRDVMEANAQKLTARKSAGEPLTRLSR